MLLKKFAAVAALVLLLGGQPAQAQFSDNPVDNLAAGYDSALAAYDDTGDPNALDAADLAQTAEFYASYGMYDYAAFYGYYAWQAVVVTYDDTGDPNAYDAAVFLYVGCLDAYNIAFGGF